jgi:Icc-related predicted phosphoesterase
MKIKILHSSDLHSRTHFLKRINEFDLWIDTGDFFPNRTRGEIRTEKIYQTRWFGYKVDSLVNWLGDRPAIIVPGNHDYVDLAKMLTNRGCNVYNVNNSYVDLFGLRFAGFREIPWIVGEWMGEARDNDLSIISRKCLDKNPDILVTHTPPAGILDQTIFGEKCGCVPLANMLTYTSHNIRAHFFGHIHHQGGQMLEDMGITFYNGAENVRLIDLDIK